VSCHASSSFLTFFYFLLFFLRFVTFINYFLLFQGARFVSFFVGILIDSSSCGQNGGN